MQPSEWHRIAPLLRLEDGPRTTAEIAVRLDLPKDAVEGTLRQLCRSGHVIRVAANRHLHAQEVARLAAIAETLAREEPGGLFDVASYRKRAALGRDLAIAVLEHFDRIGLTRRIGDHRRMLRPAGSMLKRTRA
jgi:selenocysteine-specific elongation factor